MDTMVPLLTMTAYSLSLSSTVSVPKSAVLLVSSPSTALTDPVTSRVPLLVRVTPSAICRTLMAGTTRVTPSLISTSLMMLTTPLSLLADLVMVTVSPDCAWFRAV